MMRRGLSLAVVSVLAFGAIGESITSSTVASVVDMESDGAYLLDIDGAGLAEASQVCYESSEQRAFLGYALQYQGYNSRLGVVRIYRDVNNQPVYESYTSIYTTNWGSGDLGSHYVEKNSSYYPSGTFDRTTVYAGTWLEGFNDLTMFVSPTVEGLSDAIAQTFTICENTASSDCTQSGSYALHITIQEGIRTLLEGDGEETSSCTPKLPSNIESDSDTSANSCTNSENSAKTVTKEFVDTLPTGWNLIGTGNDISDFDIFSTAKTVWVYKDGSWKSFKIQEDSKTPPSFTIDALDGFWLQK